MDVGLTPTGFVLLFDLFKLRRDRAKYFCDHVHVWFCKNHHPRTYLDCQALILFIASHIILIDSKKKSLQHGLHSCSQLEGFTVSKLFEDCSEEDA